MAIIRNATFSTQPAYAQLRRQLKGIGDDIACIAISPDSLQIAGGSKRGKMRLWDRADGSGFEVKPVKQPGEGEATTYSTCFSPNGQYLATSMGKVLHIWTAKTGQPQFEFVHQDCVTCIAFSPDSKYLACGAKDIYIWKVETRQQVHVFKGHTDYIKGLSYGRWRLASTSQDSTIRIWNLEQGGILEATWKGHGNNAVYCCALSPDELKLASGGHDKQVIIWEVQTGKWLTRPYQGHSRLVWSISFSSDGKQIASASTDGIHIQDSKTGSCIAKVDGSDGCVAYTPDGRHIVTRDKADHKLVRVSRLTTATVPPPSQQNPGSSGEGNRSRRLPGNLTREVHWAV